MLSWHYKCSNGSRFFCNVTLSMTNFVCTMFGFKINLKLKLC